MSGISGGRTGDDAGRPGTTGPGVDAGRSGAPLLRIVSGDPSPEELAALVTVLAAAAAGAEEPTEPEPASQWATPERLLRAPVAPTGWWASALPR